MATDPVLPRMVHKLVDASDTASKENRLIVETPDALAAALADGWTLSAGQVTKAEKPAKAKAEKA